MVVAGSMQSETVAPTTVGTASGVTRTVMLSCTGPGALHVYGIVT